MKKNSLIKCFITDSFSILKIDFKNRSKLANQTFKTNNSNSLISDKYYDTITIRIKIIIIIVLQSEHYNI